MFHASQGRLKNQVAKYQQQVAAGKGLPFSNLLPRRQVQQVLKQQQVHWRQKVFTPLVTLYTFLGQVLSADRSCCAAVARVLVWLMRVKGQTCSPRTGGYCQARERLPESVPHGLMQQVGWRLHRSRSDQGLLHGRPVKMVDGSTVSMPDTKANQQAYPQSSSQKRGVGFPIARVVALFCLGTAAVLDLAIGPYRGKRTGETALFRKLWHHLRPGDVLMGDRYFSSFWDIAMLLRDRVDSIFRVHQRRHCDFRRGKRLGKYDRLVVWRKPTTRPEWMDRATYGSLPKTLSLRLVKVQVPIPGFRTRQLVLVTTLLDADAVTREQLAELYRARWHAEVDLRSIKCAMQMDVLRCKTPAMVRKEIWMHLLAYNLIRTVMAEAAAAHGCAPRQISFSGAMQTLAAFSVWPWSKAMMDDAWVVLLAAVAAHRVGDRPNRVEPRAVKRRPKPHKLLREPRAKARRRLLGRARTLR
jgi:hypothetical protein